MSTKDLKGDIHTCGDPPLLGIIGYHSTRQVGSEVVSWVQIANGIVEEAFWKTASVLQLNFISE